MRCLKILIAIVLVALACGFSEAANDDKGLKDNLLYSATSSGSFNNCEYEYKGDAIRIFADDSRDPGVFFGKINKDTTGSKYLSFAIKGKLIRMGQWCFPVVQVFDEKDDEYTPSITKTSFMLNEDEFETVRIPLEGKISRLAKVQFILVTDKGSWDIQIKDARLE